MNIYKLELTFDVGMEALEALMVVASDEDAARLIASERHYDLSAWLDPELCKATKIDLSVSGVVFESWTSA